MAGRIDMYLTENKKHVTDHGPFKYDREITLTVRRLDHMDPITGGNKWYKLKYNLEKFIKGDYSRLLTFGGAWSNHIAAVARAGKLAGISTTAIVRGESPSGGNITLTRAARDGMDLIFVSRSEYLKRNEPEFVKKLVYGNESYYVLPEGGSNMEGVKGCQEILNENDRSYNDIVIACGTGATAAGIISTLQPEQHLTGISVLRDGGSIGHTIHELLAKFYTGPVPGNWNIENEFHGGGYAKSNPELIAFIKHFETKTGIKTEPIYTGKLFYAIEKLIVSGKFKPGSRILAIHTGGLQYLLDE